MKSDICNIILDDAHFRSMKRIIDLSSTIADGTDLMQSDASVSVVFYQFSEWDKYFAENDDDLSDFILDKVHQRWDLISHNCHAAAFSLDPRFRGHSIDVQDLEDAEKYLCSITGEKLWNNKIYDQFMEYRTAQGVFSGNRWQCKLKDDPLRPWKFIGQTIQYKQFAEIAIHVLSIPTGIAAVERTFSATRRIHTWDRASLAAKTVDKLIFIYWNLRLMENEGLNDEECNQVMMIVMIVKMIVKMIAKMKYKLYSFHDCKKTFTFLNMYRPYQHKPLPE